ncbi:MAG: amidase family protein [Candidatus Aenigmatarchaeota archaeon]
MNYKISVAEFLRSSASGNIDYNDFVEKFTTKAAELNKKYNFLNVANNKSPKPSPNLFGLPVSVKDCICTKGIQTAAGSKMLEGYIPSFDATCVSRIKENGGFICGKTNQDEFGFGTFSVNCAYGKPRNPIDPERSCGGSSGGAAGLTAAMDMPHIAIAESTGGSISCPAAFCGVVGLTPTYGLVSRYGLVDYACSLDKIGVIGKSVYDAALMLSHIGGFDNRDSTSLKHEKQDYTKYVNSDMKGKKIGVPKEYFNASSEVKKSVWAAIKKLESLGAECTEFSLPSTKFALSAYYIIATAEASTNLARYCGMRYGLHKDLHGNFNEYFSDVRSTGFGEEAKRRIILGTFARMAGYRNAYYLKALKVRSMIISDFKRAFRKFDVIAAPTMSITAPRFSEIEKLSPLQVYQMDLLTIPTNLAGMPHISVPCGSMIGLHLIGNHLEEGKIIEVAAAYEKSR